MDEFEEYPINFVEGALYDSEGKEIVVPEGHNIVIGDGRCAFAPMGPIPAAKLVYRVPKEKKDEQ